MTSTADNTQETIACERISASQLRFFISTQLEECRGLESQLDTAREDISNEDKSDDEREVAHGRLHELMEEPCPISTKLEAIAEDYILRFDHDCRGVIDIDINLAKVTKGDLAAVTSLVMKQVTKILKEGILSLEEPRVLVYEPL